MAHRDSKEEIIMSAIKLSPGLRNGANASQRENSGSFPEFGSSDSPATLGVDEIRVEFNRLDSKLESQVPKVAKARETLARAVPVLSDLQALLSQRGSHRRSVLKEAKLPRWTEYIERYAQKTGYTARQLRSRIREFRTVGAPTKKTRHCSLPYRLMLDALMEVVERFGQRCPVPVHDHCRLIRDAIAGKIEPKFWRRRVEELAMAAGVAAIEPLASSRDAHTLAVVGDPVNLAHSTAALALDTEPLV
jgi:hypothetical protein